MHVSNKFNFGLFIESLILWVSESIPERIFWKNPTDDINYVNATML